MMFANKFILAIRVNGKILRENKGTVTLPFGCEYELLLKNLNSRRAMVGVSIDGKRTSDCRFVIPANSEITLERYINNGNMNSGNRFKFIERTSKVEEHRGIGSDDGLVRAEFWAEREVMQAPRVDYSTWLPQKPYDRRRRDDFGGPTMFRSFSGITGQSVGGSDDSGITYGRAQGGAEMPGSGFVGAQTVAQSTYTSSLNAAQNMMKLADNDAGITVPGSESSQQFHKVNGFELETTSTVVILQLCGEIGGQAVAAPITVEYKPVCITCGKTNKALSRFCNECGTALKIL
jgi:hypothetical protein